jgi:hypothetical protein
LLFICAFAFRTAGVSPAPLPLPPFEILIFNLKFLPAPAPEARHNLAQAGRPGKKTSAKRHRLFTLSFEGRSLTRASLLNFLFAPPTSCSASQRIHQKVQF